MLRALESFFFSERWKKDEYAWRVWQGIEPLMPTGFPLPGDRVLMAGKVTKIYQRARRGTKVLVHFGKLGVQDTWWPYMAPMRGQWVVVDVHLWLPPGTHSGQHVLWVERWESWAPADTFDRAARHERRLVKERARAARSSAPAA